MSNSKHSRRGYLIFILIWTLLLFAAGAFGLYKLNDFLTVYESCELSLVKEDFEQSFGPGNLPLEVVEQYAETLDTRVMTGEEYVSIILSQAQGSVELRKISGESSSTKAVYSIVVNDVPIGKAHFDKDVPMSYGLSAWRCSLQSYDFDYLFHDGEISVPDNYTVRVNGVTLDDSFIVDRRTVDGYDNVLRYLRADARELYTYRVNTMGTQVFDIEDEDGAPVAVEDLGTEFFMENCSDEQKEAISQLGRRFIEEYTSYSSGVGYYNHYNQLSKICVSGSDIMNRLANSLEGYAYAIRRQATIPAFEIYRISAVNDTEFICDIRYTVDANANSRIISTDYDVRLLIEYDGWNYLVSVLTSNH